MLDHRRTLLVILLCAFALRLLNLTAQPLWYDEGWSVWFATSDLPTMAARTAADIHPPFYYALLHVWLALAGTGEFALRFCSVLIGVLTVACVYRLARALTEDTTATLAAMLIALSPLYVFYSQEIRMYGLVTLLGVISSWLFWKATADGRRQTALWVAYVLVTSAAMYTQYYGAFIPLFHCVFLILTTRSRRKLLFPLIAFASLFLLYLPWLLYVASQLTQYVADKVGEEKYASLSPFDYLARHLVAFAVGHLSDDVSWLAWASVLFIALLLVGLWSLRASRSTPIAHGEAVPLRDHSSLTFLLLYLLVPLAAGYLIQLRFPFAPPRMERLLLVAAPAFVVLVARGLATVNLSFKLNRIAALGVAVLLLTSALSLLSFYTVPRYAEQDYRPLAARINALALPSDVVVLVHPWQVGFLQAYLHVPVALQMVADPAWGDADRAQLDSALNAQRRVWLPAYQTLGRILETQLEKYLDQRAFLADANWFEQTRLTFYAPANQSVVLDERARVTLGELRDVALLADQNPSRYESGWGIIPVGFATTSSINLKNSMHVSVRLKDEQERVWASQDRELATAEFASTHAWKVGLPVPAGTPPGSYHLSLLIYDAETQQPIGAEVVARDVTVTRPTSPPPIGALPIGAPLVADWPDVRLLGYTLRAGAWRAGDTLHLDLFWQALESASSASKLLVQIQDAHGSIVAQDEAPTTYRAAQWQRGDLIREQRDVVLPATLAAGTYRIVVGWLGSDQHTRLYLTGGGDQLALREIAVSARAHRFTAPSMQVPQAIRFGGLATLVGYDLVRDDSQHTLRLRLYWRAQREIDSAYKVFVHLTTPDSSTPIVQHDGAPANDTLPTTSWVGGEYISDEHTLTLPADMARGTYRVLVGLYDAQSGARVPAFASDTHEFANDAAELLQVKLTNP